MTIFILEDDIDSMNTIGFAEDLGYSVKHFRRIEDAVMYLEYMGGITECKKFLFDASIAGADILHLGETDNEIYDGDFCGVDILIKNLKRWKLESRMDDIAILTAFEHNVRNYEAYKPFKKRIKLISKNDPNMVKELRGFLAI